MSPVQHMVLLKFPETTSQAQIDEIFRELEGLKQVIPGMLYFDGGPYSSHEGRHGGFTHGFLMTFDSPEARDQYLEHPEHQRVAQRILAMVQDVIAFDFVCRRPLQQTSS